MGDCMHRTDERAHGIFTMAALDGHGARGRVGHEQARIGLQACLAMALCTGGHTSIASNTFSIVGDYEMIHIQTLIYPEIKSDRGHLPGSMPKQLAFSKLPGSYGL
jgi:hypothetical protein